MPANPYDIGLDRTPANYQPLTPLGFLERAASVFPDPIAIVHGDPRRSYAGFYARARRVASALAGRGRRFRAYPRCRQTGWTGRKSTIGLPGED